MTLTSVEVIPHLSGELLRLGFRQLARSKTSNSRYFTYPGVPFRLRLSDHSWSRGSARRHVEVVASWVVVPIEQLEIPALAARVQAHFLDRIEARKNSWGAQQIGAQP